MVGSMVQVFRALSGQAVVLLLSLLLLSVQVLAQTYPTGTRIGPDGTIFITARITQGEFDGINEVLGGAASDGSLTNEKICDAVMNNLPGGFLRGLADFGSLFGVCWDQEKMIKDALENNLYPELRQRCEALSIVSLTTRWAKVCEWPAFLVRTCHFEEPSVPHSCDGLRELCEQTEAEGSMSPPDSQGPGQLAGHFKYPGCECTSFYIDAGLLGSCDYYRPIDLEMGLLGGL